MQNAAAVSMRSTSALLAASVVIWLSRFGAVASWVSAATIFSGVPLTAAGSASRNTWPKSLLYVTVAIELSSGCWACNHATHRNASVQ